MFTIVPSTQLLRLCFYAEEMSLAMRAESDRLSQAFMMSSCSDENMFDNRWSDRESERLRLNPQIIFRKMLRVAGCMRYTDQQEQKFLLSLALQAIQTVELEFESGADSDDGNNEVGQELETSEMETLEDIQASFSSPSLQVHGEWPTMGVFVKSDPGEPRNLASKTGKYDSTIGNLELTCSLSFQR
jgi:hypothetical protein